MIKNVRALPIKLLASTYMCLCLDIHLLMLLGYIFGGEPRVMG